MLSYTETSPSATGRKRDRTLEETMFAMSSGIYGPPYDQNRSNPLRSGGQAIKDLSVVWLHTSGLTSASIERHCIDTRPASARSRAHAHGCCGCPRTDILGQKEVVNERVVKLEGNLSFAHITLGCLVLTRPVMAIRWWW